MARATVSAFTGFVIILFALTVTRPADGGYATRLMYPFDIGDAPSLPWGSDWWQGRADYNLANLLADTEELLTPSPPIIVRLETLRRAAIYASNDRHVAELLFRTFSERARAAEQSRRPDPVVFLDAAFVTDTLWQIGEHSNPPFTEQSRQVRGVVDGVDGYAFIKKSRAFGLNDPALEFGAAMIAGVRRLGTVTFAEHARKARAGANHDSLVARNLDRIYAGRDLGVR